MLAYFVVIAGVFGFGVYKVLSQSSGNELPLGFDDRPKPGMRILNKLKEWIRKITRDKVTLLRYRQAVFSANHSIAFDRIRRSDWLKTVTIDRS